MPKSRLRKKKSPYTPKSEVAERKAVKIGPRPWIAPLMIGLFLFGLLWIVVYYIAPDAPFLASLSYWNVVIGFVLIGFGFVVSTKWK